MHRIANSVFLSKKIKILHFSLFQYNPTPKVGISEQRPGWIMICWSVVMLGIISSVTVFLCPQSQHDPRGLEPCETSILMGLLQSRDSPFGSIVCGFCSLDLGVVNLWYNASYIHGRWNGDPGWFQCPFGYLLYPDGITDLKQESFW